MENSAAHAAMPAKTFSTMPAAGFSCHCDAWKRDDMGSDGQGKDDPLSPTIFSLLLSQNRHEFAAALLSSGIIFDWLIAVYGSVLPCGVVIWLAVTAGGPL